MFESLASLFDGEIDDRVEQRMAGSDQVGVDLAGSRCANSRSKVTRS